MKILLLKMVISFCTAGGAGGEEGVIAEVTLPLLKEAVGLPQGTQAAAGIIGGVTTLAVSAVRHLFLPDIESVCRQSIISSSILSVVVWPIL